MLQAVLHCSVIGVHTYVCVHDLFASIASEILFCFFPDVSAGPPPPRTHLKKRNGPPIHSFPPFLFCAGEGGLGVLTSSFSHTCPAREKADSGTQNFLYEKGTGNFIFQNISFSFHCTVLPLPLSRRQVPFFPEYTVYDESSLRTGQGGSRDFPPCSPHGFVLRGVGGEVHFTFPRNVPLGGGGRKEKD